MLKKKKAERRKSLPDFWQRITRPEGKRVPKRLDEDKARLEVARTADKKRYWKFFNTPLQKVQKDLKLNISATIRKEIKNFDKKNPFKVLDLGCGAGTSLSQLKQKFGGKIKTIGLVLEKTKGEKYKSVDRLILGHINQVRPRETFNLIYSYLGATTYTEMKTTALQKVISWLKPGGTAVLHIGVLGRKNPILDEMKTLLIQNGINEWQIKSTKVHHKLWPYLLIFKKPIRKLP